MPRYVEAEILAEGCKLEAPTKGSFAMNMIYRNQAWETRRGFGQFAQRSSSFGLPQSTGTLPVSPVTNTALETHHGSYMMTTNFGHEQIVSVFSGVANTADYVHALPGSAPPNVKPGNLSVRVYTVHIDDITDGTHWEVPLYRHTSDSKGKGRTSISTSFDAFFTTPLSKMHGNYETDMDLDRQNWKWAEGSEKPFIFREFQDVLMMGHESAGLWAYVPGTFQDYTQRKVQATKVFWHESAPPYAESSMVVQVEMAGTGPFADEGIEYLIPSDFPAPTAMAVLGNHMVYASDRTVYFSDPGYPASVGRGLAIVLGTEYPITAMEEQLGNLTIWTEGETWLYYPPASSPDGNLAGGTITRISDTVGCLSANCVVKAGNGMFWMDTNGVYRTTGNLIVSPVSDNISPFFTDFVTNPMTSYFVSQGTSTPVATDQVNSPDTTTKIDPRGAHLAFSPELDALFAVFPNEREMWVLSEGKWAYWTVESSVHTTSAGVPDVQVQRRIQSPWIVTSQKTIALVSGPISKTNTDANPTFQVATVAADYQVLIYGRGGTLDRSVDNEDMSVPSQSYLLVGPGGAQGRITTHRLSLYLEKPVSVPRGYKFPGGEPVINTKEVWWVPVNLVSPPNVLNPPVGIGAWNVGLAFDSTNWKPILIVPGATGDIDFQVPSERVGSAAGYAYGAGAAGTRVAQTAANTITIEFTNAANAIVFNDDRVTPLLYIPMERLTGAGVRSMGFAVSTAARFTSGGAVNQAASVLSWEHWFRGTPDAASENNVASPVDWCYKSSHVGLKGDRMLKARGLFARLLSHGSGSLVDALDPNWPYGLFNVILACDRKGWMSQVVDFNVSDTTGDDAIMNRFNKNTTRLRVRDVASVMRLKNFANTPAAGGLTYGQSGVAGAGDYLIDDEEVSIVATSDSVKGGSFSYMVFGFMQNRAQVLKIESIMAELRVLGGSRRRTGH
jgi:hypothetical protein